MQIDNKGLYAAFKGKDARFDGRFFIGIATTGIYCRPICKAKKAKEENCTFFTTAAQAEQAGYRPCLICRPELAPGTPLTNTNTQLVHQAMRLLEENCGQSIPDLAEKLGCSDRHLRRLFKDEYTITPIQYLQTCRLLLAKNLLTDTNLSILEVAMSTGFGSLRRFNDLFKSHYGMPPTALRKQTPREESQQITLSLGYRPPYLFKEMLHFLAARAIPGIEVVTEDTYSRTVQLEDVKHQLIQGWLQVSHQAEKNALSVTISDSLLPVLPLVLTKIRHLFDLYCDPIVIYEALQSMNTIRPGLYTLGTRLPGSFNGFEMAVRAILGQQITIKAATTLAGRLVNSFGKPIKTNISGLTHIFPSAQDIKAHDTSIEEELGRLGIIKTRSRAILSLAKIAGNIHLDFTSQPEKEIEKLLSIPGIGNWTAHYIAMRTMGWTDAFLETDAGIKKALEPFTPKEMLQLSEDWKPWRSYAVMGLWNSLK